MPTDRITARLVRLLVIVEVVTAVVMLSVGMALAVGRSSASASQTVTSARWGSVLVLQGATATTGPLVIDWTAVKKNPYQFIDLVNTSSLALTGQTISVSTTRNGSGSAPIPTIGFTLCRGGAWDAGTGQCSGTAVDLGSTTAGSITIVEPLAVASRLALRASTTAGVGAPFTTTFSSVVARTQVTPAITVNR